ncbi:protein FAR1-RELATED SEQUENCE 5-like [Arachis hypogaea]|uniref:protein FAR1-RELATED SEQUENCE 5-like n=1 Tax=Arachis hypogaea TaxID=3818 RepID=UPI000DEC400E|nr:protein FAR1-RELATED SEQUENCE 5-like [Arachis hypogaea]
MDQSIFEEVSYDTTYNVSDHPNSIDVNVMSLSEDDTQRVNTGKESVDFIQLKDDATAVNHELPDHTRIPIEEIPHVGLRFVSLQWAQEFYSNYARKVGFVTRSRNNNVDKTNKKSRIPINQSIHYSHEVDVDEANKFKSALWVDARCRTSYEYYGDMVSFDTTYSRNKHGLLFASFIGVNHHGKSTLLGCTLLGNEEIRSIEWIFKQWLQCMGTPPKAIIVDQCKFMLGASRNVLPNTHHQWCIWHLMKKIPHKLGGYARYRKIDARIHGNVWNARFVESFEKDWYLYDDCRMLVPIYFQGEFWAGIRSTQRSESMHAFFDGYLHCKSGLVQFVHEYDNMLGNKELEDDVADSKGVVPYSSSSTIEIQFHCEYTTSKFRKVQQEFRKKGDCLVCGATQDGDLFCVTVNEQYLPYGDPRT